MEYTNKVEALIRNIAIFAIMSKNKAPASIYFKVERTRLMEAALGLKTVAKNMDARLMAKPGSISRTEIEDFKREWDRIQGNVQDLHLHLEVQIEESRSRVSVNNRNLQNPTPTPGFRLTSQQGKVLVSEGIQQRSIPATPETPRSIDQSNSSLHLESPCICPRCSLMLNPVPTADIADNESQCSCENCQPWFSPSSIVSGESFASISTYTDSGFHSQDDSRSEI